LSLSGTSISLIALAVVAIGACAALLIGLRLGHGQLDIGSARIRLEAAR
jgi:hypothetical protein